MYMEWAKDGLTEELFILQARPETVHSQIQFETLESYRLKEKGRILVQGRGVGEKIPHGPARVIKSARNLREVQTGDIRSPIRPTRTGNRR